MAKTIDCHYWNPNLGLEDTLEFQYEDIGNGIVLRKPIFTIKALEKIIKSGHLSIPQRESAIKILKRKGDIYAAGCLKRGRKDEAEYIYQSIKSCY